MICGNINADNPENLIANSALVYGLNRYSVTTNNAVAISDTGWTIWAITQMHRDITYERQLPWLQRAFDRVVGWLSSPWVRGILIGLSVALTIVTLGVAKGLAAAIVGMVAIAGAAITGFIAGGVSGGDGDGWCWSAAADGALWGVSAALLAVAAVKIVGVVAATVGKLAKKAVVAGAVSGVPNSGVVVKKNLAGSGELWEVGIHRDLVSNSITHRHHVPQTAAALKLNPAHNLHKSPAIRVPIDGHMLPNEIGRLSTKSIGFTSLRQIIARDILELKRVFPHIPNSALQELIRLNKSIFGL